ncbi:hypothetical protein PV325_010045 [Microctonus aethiopoides]|uniref:Uncharacterized protein n=1 Tax=Microctonus aethiopoides TaxID=144406 RepID=A0AA39FJL2_9HYME|nr:hypothetical protein PV325_010045 [Microctonus aethiopoides]KAK0170646.1 hypothetical protein PV328_008473 [Microctonus aethiopoides]
MCISPSRVSIANNSVTEAFTTEVTSTWTEIRTEFLMDLKGQEGRERQSGQSPALHPIHPLLFTVRHHQLTRMVVRRFPIRLRASASILGIFSAQRRLVLVRADCDGCFEPIAECQGQMRGR